MSGCAALRVITLRLPGRLQELKVGVFPIYVALYCCVVRFRITLPPAVHEAAAAKGKPADWLYCSELLEQTGIVVVPGG